MKIVHLCRRSVSCLCGDGWLDTYRYRYERIAFTSRYEKGRYYLLARRYRLIDIAYRDYDTFEFVKIRW